MADKPQTRPEGRLFDFDAYPLDTLFHERRSTHPAEAVPEPKPGSTQDAANQGPGNTQIVLMRSLVAGMSPYWRAKVH